MAPCRTALDELPATCLPHECQGSLMVREVSGSNRWVILFYVYSKVLEVVSGL